MGQGPGDGREPDQPEPPKRACRALPNAGRRSRRGSGRANAIWRSSIRTLRWCSKTGLASRRSNRISNSAPKMQMLCDKSKGEAVAALTAQADKLTAGATGGGTESILSEAFPEGGVFTRTRTSGYDVSPHPRADPGNLPFESFSRPGAATGGVLEAGEGIPARRGGETGFTEAAHLLTRW